MAAKASMLADPGAGAPLPALRPVTTGGTARVADELRRHATHGATTGGMASSLRRDGSRARRAGTTPAGCEALPAALWKPRGAYSAAPGAAWGGAPLRAGRRRRRGDFRPPPAMMYKPRAATPGGQPKGAAS